MVTLIKLRLTFKALQDMNFPIYAGSTLRGIFGKSLKRVSCLAKQEQCEGCAARQTCPYASLFENGQVSSGKNEEIPNPYIIEPMDLGHKIIKQGELFSFNCILFGKAIEKLSYVILAWVKVGNLGFTKERTQARLIKIEQIMPDTSHFILYNFELENPLLNYPNTSMNIPEIKNITSIRVILQTPLRIQHHGHPVAPNDFTAQDFLISLLRRQKNIAQHHMPDYPCIDFNAVKADILNAEISSASLHWFDWKRYSSKQEKSIALGGIMGSFILHGNLTKLYPYLKMGEYFHLGKSAVMGMGKYKIEAV